MVSKVCHFGLKSVNSHPALDASEFLRIHPLPGRSITDTFDDSTHRTGGTRKRVLTALQVLCGRTGQEDIEEDDDEEEGIYPRHPSADEGSDRFHWTRHLQNEFRQELEKYVPRTTILHTPS